MRSRPIPSVVDLSPLSRRLVTPPPARWEAMPVAELIERIETALADRRSNERSAEAD